MIVCKLELWPGGDEELAQHLGTIEIANQLMTTVQTDGRRGTYKIELVKKRTTKKFKTTVHDFPRLAYHPWNLVRIALNQLAEKNGGVI